MQPTRVDDPDREPLSIAASADAVLNHSFKFRPQWWQPRVPDSWGSWLADLPDDAQGRGYRQIARRDLLTLPRDSDDHNGRLLVACYVWGTGDGAWLAPRRARVFRDTASAVLLQRLDEAVDVLRSDGPAAAYAAMTDGGSLRTKHMRASFFTKFLYAADAPGDGSVGSALILDQFVARALNDLHGWGLHETTGWSSETYQSWIDFAHAQASSHSAYGKPLRADAVEMAYFQYGRSLATRRRSAR